MSHPSLLLYKDVSVAGQGTYLQDVATVGVWSQDRELHINTLEMKVVLLALNTFLPRILGESVVLMSNNATVVAYLEK